MKKSLLLLLTLLSASPLMEGAVLSPQEALQRISRFSAPLTRSRQSELQLAYIQDSENGMPALYVFENLHSKGFVILSADDSAAPVLGYADESAFDANAMPPQMKWWIEQYVSQIQYARENGYGQYAVSVRESKAEIAPMIKTKWDQGRPFNNECPEINKKRALTGCVATAMAQVMNYWKYPETGRGTGTITLPGTTQQQTISFASKAFDWDNMIDSYNGEYSNEEGAAVAYLMKACGYSCDMNYSLSSSGALSMHAASALINNFKYNPNIQFWSRDYFDALEWEEMVYNEIASGRPVLYSGVSPSGGHEFVCDGYSSDGYFHFNWGWSGMSDGYFLLDALNPGNLGSGGGEGGGFNYGQDITIGIQPEATAETTPRLAQFGTLTGTQKFNYISLKVDYDGETGFWANTGIQAINVTLGASIEAVDGTSGEIHYRELAKGNVSTPTATLNEEGYYNVNYSGFGGTAEVKDLSGLKDGKYKITVCSKRTGQNDSEYLPVLTNKGYNSIYFTKSGDKFTIENRGVPELTVSDAELLTPLYAGAAARFSVTITNDSDEELSGNFFPMLLSANIPQMSANGITLSVAPHETVTKEFVSTFEPLEGVAEPTSKQVYTLVWYDPNTKVTYEWSQQVTMNINLADASVTVSDFEISGSEYVNGELSDGSVVRLYTINDTDAIPFKCTLHNNSGYFGTGVHLVVTPNGENAILANEPFSTIPTLSAGESCSLEMSLNFPGAAAGTTYMASLCTLNGNRFDPLGDSLPLFFKLSGSGVDQITADDELLRMTFEKNESRVYVTSANGLSSVAVYGIDGKAVNADISVGENPAVVDLSSLPAGIYIVRSVATDGLSKTLKVAR